PIMRVPDSVPTRRSSDLEQSGEAVQRQLRENFPADYICEAIDQTRGWFYSLHALATLLTDSGNGAREPGPLAELEADTSSFRNRSEEHTSELQSRENLVC